MPAKLKPAFVLSGFIAILAIASSVGPFSFDLYRRDSAFVMGAQQGTDLVTLFVATPLLLLGLFGAMRGSQRAKLLWISMLSYMLYNFLFYLLGAALNEFFLIYVALCALSIHALIVALNNADIAAIGERFGAKVPAKGISAYMLFFAALLAGMWTFQWYKLTFGDGQAVGVPSEAVHLIAAIDMTLFAPLLAIAAILLWRRRTLGYSLASIIMIMASVYTPVLIASAPFQFNAGMSDAWAMVPLWIFLTAGSIAASVFLLANLKPQEE